MIELTLLVHMYVASLFSVVKRYELIFYTWVISYFIITKAGFNYTCIDCEKLQITKSIDLLSEI